MVGQHAGADAVELALVQLQDVALDRRRAGSSAPRPSATSGRLTRRFSTCTMRRLPLTAAAVRGVDAGGVHARAARPDDRADRPQRDRVLAEGRQDALDVVHEHRAGADHQDAAALEAATVGVEQVGGAVQGHHGLAGAGPAAR